MPPYVNAVLIVWDNRYVRTLYNFKYTNCEENFKRTYDKLIKGISNRGKKSIIESIRRQNFVKWVREPKEKHNMYEMGFYNCDFIMAALNYMTLYFIITDNEGGVWDISRMS